jgi:hypothetical protein
VAYKTAFDLETLLTHPKLFNLTSASPLQRAICRLIEGKPLGDLADNPVVVSAVGGPEAMAAVRGGNFRSREFMLLAGIRGGKSLLAACLAVYASQTIEIDGLRPGEIPRFSVLSLTKSHAGVVFQHLVGSIQASPLLSLLIVGEPKGDTIFLKHPSGMLVEVAVVPIDRAGGSLVSRWSAGAVFDEAPRWQSEQEGVLNLTDAREAVIARLRKGAQLIMVGSPWAPKGPIYDRFQERFGTPGDDITIIKAPAPALNPVYWTPERIQKETKDRNVYRRDILSEFASPESAMFDSDMLENLRRKKPGNLLPVMGNDYAAAMDPATRSNSWPFMIVTKEGGVKKVAYFRQFQGSSTNPLNPDEVLRDIAAVCRQYDIKAIHTDQWSGDALQSIANRHGVGLIVNNLTRSSKVEYFDHLHKDMIQGLWELPDENTLVGDLISVKKRVTTSGMEIFLPKIGGRHADSAICLALLAPIYLSDPVPELTNEQKAQQEREEKRRKIFEKNPEKAWWDPEKDSN